MTNPASAGAQQGRGRFAKGRSGNPRGRKPGTRNHVSVLAERLMGDDAEAVVRATIAAAMAGDMSAARLILDRVAPIRRGRPISIDLPPIGCAADLATAAGVITREVAAGGLTPEEGVALGGVMELQRRAIETADLAARLDVLEGKLGHDNR